jgi:hypothetical protein
MVVLLSQHWANSCWLCPSPPKFAIPPHSPFISAAAAVMVNDISGPRPLDLHSPFICLGIGNKCSGPARSLI